MRSRTFLRIAAVLLISTALIAGQTAQSGENLFQQALQKERVDRDIDGAIKLYDRIVKEFTSNRPLVARALVQLGLCYEKLGEAGAQDYFEQVIAKFSDQTEMVAAARSRVTSPAATTARFTSITSSGKAVAAAISPDGKQVVYATSEGTKQSLWLRELASFTNKLIAAPSDFQYVKLWFSIDGTSLYYVAWDRGQPMLFRTTPPGQNPTRVISVFRNGDVTFSPDGKRVAFVRARSGEYVVTVTNSDGSDEQSLVGRPMGVDTIGQRLSWSPDGQTIVYTSNAGANPSYNNLVAVSVRDRTEKAIPIRTGQSLQSIAWVPDGSGLIVSSLNRAVDPVYQLWHVSYPDGRQRKITNDLHNYEGISLSADSSKLVTLQTSTAVTLWTTPRNEPGSAAQVASRTGKDDGQSGVAWAPDGHIVYTSTDAGMSDLWIMNSDGSNRRPLIAGQGRNLSPAVSPDGRYVIFISDRGGPYALWRLNLETGELKYLAVAVSNAHPQFSPDGKWIVYHQLTTINGPATATNEPPSLWRIAVDGGSPERMTSYHSRNATISPDGTLMAYTYIDGGPKVDIVSVNGGKPVTTLHPGAIPSLVVRWTPDSRGLSFIRTQNGTSNVWVQPLDGGPSTPVTDFQTDQIHDFDWSRDGRLVISRGTPNRDVVLISSFR